MDRPCAICRGEHLPDEFVEAILASPKSPSASMTLKQFKAWVEAVAASIDDPPQAYFSGRGRLAVGD